MKSFLKKMKINSLEKKNAQILEKAMQFQRNGKLEDYARLIQESEELIKVKKKLEDELA